MNPAPELKANFDKAIELGDIPVAQDLIKNPAILAYLASQYSSNGHCSFSFAAMVGHTEIVKLLLTIPVVRANAAAQDNEALRYAVENGHTEIVKLLLGIPTVESSAAFRDNEGLVYAASKGHAEIVRLLLAIPCVVQAITVIEHEALQRALSNEHWDIVLLLLQHYGSNSIPHSLVTRALAVPAEHQSAGIRSIICNRVMTVSGRYAATSNEAKAIDAWIGFWNFSPWPANTPINNRNWCDYLYAQSVHCTEPKQAAILLLSLNVMAENRGRHLTSQNVAGGGESAMESSLVAMVTKRNPPITNINPGLLAALKEIYINELEKALTAGFIACDKAQVYSLFDALVMLTRDNAWDVILNPDMAWRASLMDKEDDSYSPALLKERQAFMARHLQAQALYERMQNVLFNKYKLAMDEDDRVLVQALLVDIGGGEAAPYITSAYNKRITALDASMGEASGRVRVSQSEQQSNDKPMTSNKLRPQ